MVVKSEDKRHFRKSLGGDSFSDRIILPKRDAGARVKVTRFFGAAGQMFPDVRYPVDETVHIIFGHGIILAGNETWKFSDGTTYYLPAGETYSLECISEVIGICVFSQAADGTLPKNERTPAKKK